MISATHRDLPAMLAAGRYRADLYYRIAVFPLRVPPLRERGDDVVALARFFLERSAARIGRPLGPISDATLARLRAYPWPGNVRELENVIERAAILATGGALEVPAEMLPDPGAASAAAPRDVPAAPGALLPLAAAEREHIRAALERSGGRIEGLHGAAAALGLRPSTLRSRMQRHGIRRERQWRWTEPPGGPEASGPPRARPGGARCGRCAAPLPTRGSGRRSQP